MFIFSGKTLTVDQMRDYNRSKPDPTWDKNYTIQQRLGALIADLSMFMVNRPEVARGALHSQMQRRQTDGSCHLPVEYHKTAASTGPCILILPATFMAKYDRHVDMLETPHKYAFSFDPYKPVSQTTFSRYLVNWMDGSVETDYNVGPMVLRRSVSTGVYVEYPELSAKMSRKQNHHLNTHMEDYVQYEDYKNAIEMTNHLNKQLDIDVNDTPVPLDVNNSATPEATVSSAAEVQSSNEVCAASSQPPALNPSVEKDETKPIVFDGHNTICAVRLLRLEGVWKTVIFGGERLGAQRLRKISPFF